MGFFWRKLGNRRSAGAAQHLRREVVGYKATKWGWSRRQRSWPGYKNKTGFSTIPVNIYAGQHGASRAGLWQNPKNHVKIRAFLKVNNWWILETNNRNFSNFFQEKYKSVLKISLVKIIFEVLKTKSAAWAQPEACSNSGFSCCVECADSRLGQRLGDS